MALFPRRSAAFTPYRQEMGPFFNLFNDTFSELQQLSDTASRTFAPKFDVKEAKDSYVLEVELPGVDQKDVVIEFADEQTITVKGRTEAATDEDIVKWDCAFINNTIEKMHDHGPSSTKSSSGCSTPPHSLDSRMTRDEVPRCYPTPLSSVYNEDLVDPAILTGVTGPDPDVIEVVNLTRRRRSALSNNLRYETGYQYVLNTDVYVYTFLTMM